MDLWTLSDLFPWAAAAPPGRPLQAFFQKPPSRRWGRPPRSLLPCQSSARALRKLLTRRSEFDTMPPQPASSFRNTLREEKSMRAARVFGYRVREIGSAANHSSPHPPNPEKPFAWRTRPAGRRFGVAHGAVLIGLVMFASARSDAATLACDVAIIGGGPAGVHTAYKLATMHLTPGPVCLFEKKDHLGGRVGNNVNVGFASTPFLNGGVPVLNSGQTGTGGYRMYFNQYTYKLGQELAALGQPGQLSFLAQNSFSRLAAVTNRGLNPSFTEARYFTYNNFGIAKHFAPLYNSPINDNDMWKVLLCGPQVPVDQNNFPQYRKMAIPGLGTMSTTGYLEYVAQNVISPQHGPDVAQYLLDVWRFRGDFDSPNDAVSYLEFTAKDYTGGTVFYPIPSFQPYFDIMQSQINMHGGQIFFNEKVLSVNTQSTGPRYVLTTSANKTVTANTVIIATNHSALKANDPNDPSGGMTGSVISQIVSQPEFQYVQESHAVTVTHQFGDGLGPNSGWWHGDITYPTGSNLLGPQLTASSSPLRRSTNNFLIPGDLLPKCKSPACDFRNTLFFNNTNELPLTDYHDFINVSRSVYNDKGDAVENWVALFAAGEALSPNGGGNTAVNNQILKSL